MQVDPRFSRRRGNYRAHGNHNDKSECLRGSRILSHYRPASYCRASAANSSLKQLSRRRARPAVGFEQIVQRAGRLEPVAAIVSSTTSANLRRTRSSRPRTPRRRLRWRRSSPRPAFRRAWRRRTRPQGRGSGRGPAARSSERHAIWSNPAAGRIPSTRSGYVRAYWIGVRMSGGESWAITEPSTNSTIECTTDSGWITIFDLAPAAGRTASTPRSAPAPC